jgi:hypothetical protein
LRTSQRRDLLGHVDVGVDRQAYPAAPGGGGQPGHAVADLRLQPVLRHPHQRLGRQPDVADRVDLHQPGDERLQPRERHVGHVATGDDDVAHPRRAVQVVDHRVQPVDRLRHELQLRNLRRRVSDQVHPGAVPAVLRAGRQDLGQHLGGVAVGQALDRPHLLLVQRVAGGERMRRPVGVAVGVDRQHVAADRVGVDRIGAGRLGRHDRVEHLRRDQQRHRGPLGLVALEVGIELIADEVAPDGTQLPHVLDAM